MNDNHGAAPQPLSEQALQIVGVILGGDVGIGIEQVMQARPSGAGRLPLRGHHADLVAVRGALDQHRGHTPHSLGGPQERREQKTALIIEEDGGTGPAGLFLLRARPGPASGRWLAHPARGRHGWGSAD